MTGQVVVTRATMTSSMWLLRSIDNRKYIIVYNRKEPICITNVNVIVLIARLGYLFNYNPSLGLKPIDNTIHPVLESGCSQITDVSSFKVYCLFFGVSYIPMTAAFVAAGSALLSVLSWSSALRFEKCNEGSRRAPCRYAITPFDNLFSPLNGSGFILAGKRSQPETIVLGFPHGIKFCPISLGGRKISDSSQEHKQHYIARVTVHFTPPQQLMPVASSPQEGCPKRNISAYCERRDGETFSSCYKCVGMVVLPRRPRVSSHWRLSRTSFGASFRPLRIHRRAY